MAHAIAIPRLKASRAPSTLYSAEFLIAVHRWRARLPCACRRRESCLTQGHRRGASLMQAGHRISVLSSAALAACAVMSAANPAQAAPAAYQTAVTGNNPYVYYRFNDAGGDETTGLDASGSGRHGTYNGDSTLVPPTPVGGQPGTGLLSDNAVAFRLGSGVTRNYLRAPIPGFGSLVDGDGVT